MYVSESTEPKLIKLTQEGNIVTLAPNSENSTVTMGSRSVESATAEPNVSISVLKGEGSITTPKSPTKVDVEGIPQFYINQEHSYCKVIKKLQCDQCNKTYASKDSLKAHKLRHTGEKSHSCSVCDKKFKLDSYLTRHMRIHTGESLHKCNYCYKYFAAQSDLKTHERAHAGKKPFKCDWCYKSFSQKQHLTVHSRIHTGEKPFKCTKCDKQFNQNSILKRHILIHEKEKSHSCSVCHKKFSDRSKFTKHIKQHSVRSESDCQQSIPSNQIISSTKGTPYTVTVKGGVDEPNSNEDGAGGKCAAQEFTNIHKGLDIILEKLHNQLGDEPNSNEDGAGQEQILAKLSDGGELTNLKNKHELK